MSRRPLDIFRLGRVEYADGLELMAAFHAARVANTIPDTLLLLEHPAVLTLGRKARRDDVLIDRAELDRRGWPVVETDRGGEVTYHGPGQLVGYPIVDLSPDRRDVRRYVRDLEETMLRTAADAGVVAGRVAGLNGIWLSPDAEPASPGPSRKLGAVGVHLARWVSTHGFALNVNTDLSAYRAIVACGIRDRAVTSLAHERGERLDPSAVESSVIRHFAVLFEASASERPLQRCTIQVQVVRQARGERQVLALRRVAARGGFWQPVTGRLEAGETPEQAAQREVQEETGLTAPVVGLDYRHAFLYPAAQPKQQPDGHPREASKASGFGGPVAASAVAPTLGEEVAFMAEAPEAFEPQLSDEHDAFAWVPLTEAQARFPFAGLRRAASLALARSQRREGEVGSRG